MARLLVDERRGYADMLLNLSRVLKEAVAEKQLVTVASVLPTWQLLKTASLVLREERGDLRPSHGQRSFMLFYQWGDQEKEFKAFLGALKAYRGPAGQVSIERLFLVRRVLMRLAKKQRIAPERMVQLAQWLGSVGRFHHLRRTKPYLFGETS